MLSVTKNKSKEKQAYVNWSLRIFPKSNVVKSHKLEKEGGYKMSPPDETDYSRETRRERREAPSTFLLEPGSAVLDGIVMVVLMETIDLAVRAGSETVDLAVETRLEVQGLVGQVRVLLEEAGWGKLKELVLRWGW